MGQRYGSQRAALYRLYPGLPCHYCGGESATVDHIVPRSKGGGSRILNLVPACLPCNELKANRWPTCPCSTCVAAVRFWEDARSPDTDSQYTPEFRDYLRFIGIDPEELKSLSIEKQRKLIRLHVKKLSRRLDF